jgi:CheY-like chemotaxis protein
VRGQARIFYKHPTALPYMRRRVAGMGRPHRRAHNDGHKEPRCARMRDSTVEHNLSAFVVEDSAILVERLREMLVSVEGVELIDVVDTEVAALRAISSEEIDVVLLDLRLREGDGFGVLRTIAARAKRPVVIVLSNYSLVEYRRTAQALGAQYFLDKAHEMEGLPAILTEIRQRNLH